MTASVLKWLSESTSLARIEDLHALERESRDDHVAYHSRLDGVWERFYRKLGGIEVNALRYCEGSKLSEMVIERASDRTGPGMEIAARRIAKLIDVPVAGYREFKKDSGGSSNSIRPWSG